MSDSIAPSQAIVIGAGLGGLASAMRLGAKGYQVTVIDKLDRVGGRGSSITMGGHRFDLGPTIVTVPQGLRDLWAACGRDFDREVTLKPMKPFYEIPLAGWVIVSATCRQGRDRGRGRGAVTPRPTGVPQVPVRCRGPLLVRL